LAEHKEDKISRLKQELTLVRVSKKNAATLLESGKVVPASNIEDIYNREAAILAQITKLENGEEPAPSIPEDTKSGEGNAEFEGIPERLLVKKRHYTMSAEAHRQRQQASKSPAKAKAMAGNSNAWKTGEYAQGFIKQIFRPCKSTCPHYPCALVEEGETAPGEFCLDKVEVVKNIHAVQKALETGDLKDFKGLAAVRIAGGMQILNELAEDILKYGTLIKSDIFGKDGLLGQKIVSNPSLLPYSKLFEVLGVTPTNFMITPKAVKDNDTEKEKAKSITDAMSEIGKSLRRGSDADHEE
jgi:hypothetical protein